MDRRGVRSGERPSPGDTASPPRAPREITFAFGLPRSGSTWVFNVARQVLETRGYAVSAFFGASLDQMPDAVAASAGPLLIKTHNLRGFPEPLLASARTLASVRDPRDAVASAMQMFGYDFDLALRIIGRSADSLRLATGEIMVLRYEDVFAREAGAIEDIAAFLGASPTPLRVRDLARELSAERVKQKIAHLQAAGMIGSDAEPFTHDAETHWHPAHIKDGRAGNHATLLTAAQANSVAERTREALGAYYPQLANARCGS